MMAKQSCDYTSDKIKRTNRRSHKFHSPLQHARSLSAKICSVSTAKEGTALGLSARQGVSEARRSPASVLYIEQMYRTERILLGYEENRRVVSHKRVFGFGKDQEARPDIDQIASWGAQYCNLFRLERRCTPAADDPRSGMPRQIGVVQLSVRLVDEDAVGGPPHPFRVEANVG